MMERSLRIPSYYSISRKLSTMIAFLIVASTPRHGWKPHINTVIRATLLYVKHARCTLVFEAYMYESRCSLNNM